MKKFSVQFIGTSSEHSSHHRCSSSTLLTYEEDLYLIDCGDGCSINLSREKINLAKLKTILFTNLSINSLSSIISILQQLKVLKRKNSLTVIAPNGIVSYLNSELSYFDLKIDFTINVIEISPSYTQKETCSKKLVNSEELQKKIRTNWGLEVDSSLNFIKTTTVHSRNDDGLFEKLYADNNFRISAAWMVSSCPSFTYIIDETNNDRRIMVSGSNLMWNVQRNVYKYMSEKTVDLLIYSSYEGDIPTDHKTNFSSIFNKENPLTIKTMILTRLPSNYKSIDDLNTIKLYEEITTRLDDIFHPPAVFIADDLYSYNIK
ncbi:hypothetical protein SNEBB_011375 [Seison nebaliae]|nr:hypothetical protein SNEBB_011375 [Seison nebaliae]